MSKPNVSMLRLALRKIKSKPQPATPSNGDVDAPEVSASGGSPLDQAMAEFASATNDADRSRAFRAALELAKS